MHSVSVTHAKEKGSEANTKHAGGGGRGCASEPSKKNREAQ